MKEWIESWSLLIWLVICTAGLAYIALTPPVVVQAAPPVVPDICKLVATVGSIDTYYCQPDEGPDFLTNSVGFIAVEK